jgi:hypothetical protein
MAVNEPTRIVTDWFLADPEEAARIQQSTEGDDFGDIRGGAEDYIAYHIDTPPGQALIAWGVAAGLAHGSRENLVRMISDHIDWQYVNEQIVRGDPGRR